MKVILIWLHKNRYKKEQKCICQKTMTKNENSMSKRQYTSHYAAMPLGSTLKK